MFEPLKNVLPVGSVVKKFEAPGAETLAQQVVDDQQQRDQREHGAGEDGPAGELVLAPARRADREARKLLRRRGGWVLRAHAPAAAPASRSSASAVCPLVFRCGWLGRDARRTKHPRHAVDEQRQHEQHEPGGEQRRAVQSLGLAELVGDDRGETVALPEQVMAERRASRRSGSSRRSSRRSPGRGRASRRRRCPSGSRAGPPCGSSPSASPPARAPPPCGRRARSPSPPC